MVSRLPFRYRTNRSRRVVRYALGTSVLRTDPTPALARWRCGHFTARGVLCCVYRSRNAAFVDHVVRQARGLGLDVRLWALDAVVPGLADVTIASGSGARSELLNRLLDASARDPDGWTLLVDDDVAIPRRGIAVMLALADAAGLDLVQPAHGPSSFTAHAAVRARPWSLVRRTGFVEVGPIVAISRRGRDMLLPLDASLGMGWGQDFVWAQTIRDSELRGGVVDAVRIEHEAPTAGSYDRTVERERLRRHIADLGFTSPSEPMWGSSAWRPWRRSLPW